MGRVSVSSSPPKAAIRWWLHASALIAFLFLCWLGTWQVMRLQWKTQLIARIAAAQTAPPEPLNAVLNRLQDKVQVDYVRVQFTCSGLEVSPTVGLFSLDDGNPARRLITACPIQVGPYHSLLVDRGFVVSGKSATGAPDLTTPVIGVLRKPDPPNAFTPVHTGPGADWYVRDIPAMAAALKVQDPAPVVLMLESPAPATGSPRPSPLPVDIPNNHLGYVITWYGLALALAGVYIAFVRRARRG
jgi:surfeit locus 1 family protein